MFSPFFSEKKKKAPPCPLFGHKGESAALRGTTLVRRRRGLCGRGGRSSTSCRGNGRHPAQPCRFFREKTVRCAAPGPCSAAFPALPFSRVGALWGRFRGVLFPSSPCPDKNQHNTPRRVCQGGGEKMKQRRAVGPAAVRYRERFMKLQDQGLGTFPGTITSVPQTGLVVNSGIVTPDNTNRIGKWGGFS